MFFFFNDTATTEIYTYGHTLSLRDALPISVPGIRARPGLAADRDLGAASGGVRLHRPGLRRGGLGGAHLRLRVRDRVRAAGAPRHGAAAAAAEGVLGLALGPGAGGWGRSHAVDRESVV